MVKANRLGMYSDVRQILDAALASGGGEVECANHGAAIHWRQRAYKFRKLYAETLGLARESQYDAIVLPRPDDAVVTIKVGRAPVVFRPSGDTPALDLDPLAAIANELFDKLEGKSS